MVAGVVWQTTARSPSEELGSGASDRLSATVEPLPGAGAEDPVPPPELSPTPTAPRSPQPTDIRYRACDRVPPAAGSTRLTAHDAEEGADLRARLRVPSGPLVLEHGADLVLEDGTVLAGNGYEAAGAGVTPVPVAPPGTVAPVTLQVLASPESGRRVAFLEVHLGPGAVVTWSEVAGLGIGTDGGDGGFDTGTAQRATEDDPLTGYPDAFFPAGDSGSGNVCVLRQGAEETRPSGVLFTTGYGDGGYPTYGGRDAAGRLVSLVSYGGIVPWALSGLPGPVPPDVVRDEADLEAQLRD